MNKFLHGLPGIIFFFFGFAYTLLGGATELLGQQMPSSPETLRLKQHPVQFDQALGAGTAIIGEGRLRQVDTTLVEIPPGGALAPHRHLAEEMIYIVSGNGYSLMWNRTEGKKERYEWAEGDLLSPALNSWHQHFNGSSDTPARYLSITTTPLTENVFHNSAFLSSSDFSFEERWGKAVGQRPEYVGNATEGPDTVRMNVGHILPNLRNREMKDRGERMLGITINPSGDMADNRLLEMEVREFVGMEATTPSHRHLWEVVYYILSGEGYVLLQREGEAERRVDWKEGDLFIVEANEYHNLRPLADAGVRFLQIKASGYFRRVGIDPYLMQNKPLE